MYDRGIEAFIVVVRTRSISKAAELLCLAQSTISKRIQVLEERLGTTLIERGKGIKSVLLTPAGEDFVNLAERWSSLGREMKILQKSSNIVLSIGLLDSFANSFFPSLFAHLTHQHPQANIKIITAHSDQHYSLVEGRQVDVALTLLEQAHHSVNVEKCFTDPLVVLRTAAFHQLPPTVYNISELDPQYELYVRWNLTYQLWHDTHWSPGDNRFFLDTAQLILLLMREDSFWAIVPLSVAKKAVSSGNFSIGYLSDPPPDRIIYKLTHKYPKASTVESLRFFDQSLEFVLKNQ